MEYIINILYMMEYIITTITLQSKNSRRISSEFVHQKKWVEEGIKTINCLPQTKSACKNQISLHALKSSFVFNSY